MELKKAQKTSWSWSYRQGFKKGIEIAKSNQLQHGYFADEENEKAIYGFQKQVNDKMDKEGNALNYNQIEWRKGAIEGIKYTYGSYGKQKYSPSERREQQHYYGERKSYDGTDFYGEIEELMKIYGN